MKGIQHVFHFTSGSPPEGLNKQLRSGTNCTQDYHHTCQTVWVHGEETRGPSGETKIWPRCVLKYIALPPSGATLVILRKYVQKAGKTKQNKKPYSLIKYLPSKVSACYFKKFYKSLPAIHLSHRSHLLMSPT